MIRGLTTGLTKHRKSGGAEGLSMSQADYLQSLGITEKDGLVAMLEKVAPDLNRARAEGHNEKVYLAEHGFREQEERDSLIEAVRNLDALKIRLQKTKDIAGSIEQQEALGESEIKKDKAWQKTTPAGRIATAEARHDITTVIEGQKALPLTTLMEEAQDIPEVHAGDMSRATYLGDWVRGLAQLQGPDEGKRLRHQRVALKDLERRARSAGVKEGEMGFNPTTFEGLFTPAPIERVQDYVTRVEGLIAQHGGQLSPDMSAAMNRLATALDENTKATNATRANPNPNPAPRAPAPLPGAPRGGPARP